MLRWLSLVWSLVFFLALPAFALPVQEVVSKLGVKAWLIEDNSNPTVTMHFAFRGGVEQDEADKQGLSVLLADLLTEGAGKRDARAFQQVLADNSIRFGLEASRDVISGSFYGLTSALPQATELMRDTMLKPRFDPEAIARLKERQAGAIKARLADPEWQARRALYAMIYGDHPYAYRSLGTATTLAAITRTDLQQAFQRRFARDNLLVAVVGAVKPEALAELLDKVFGDLPVHAGLRPVAEVALPEKAQTLHLEQDGGQSYLLFVAPGIKRDDPDWHAATLLNYVLGGGGFASRLMQEVRTKRGLTYSIDTALATMERGGLIVGEAKTANDKAGVAWQATRQVWQDVFDDGITDNELKAAQDYLIGALPTSFTAPGAIAGMLLALQKDNLPMDYLDRRAGLLRAVTTNDIARVANRLLDPKHLTLVTVGKPEGIVAERTEKFVDE